MPGRRRYLASNSDALGSRCSCVSFMCLVSRVDRSAPDQPILTSPPTRRMLLRLPRCATYSRNSPSRLCDDHAMGSVTGAKPAKALPPVLCVDLDGTLIRGNVLWECALVLLKTRPFTLLLFPFWLLSGRAALKRKLAARVHLNPARLPYRQHVLDLLREEKAAGRRIALATAADRDLAEAISSYLGLFDEVHASDGQLNLKGSEQSRVSSPALRPDRLRVCGGLRRRYIAENSRKIQSR